MSDVDEEVRRVLCRDSLLMMAVDADEAVGIVRQRETLARLKRNEATLFEAALEHHHDATLPDRQRHERARAWRYAGIIVQFSDLVGIPVRLSSDWADLTAADMYRESLRQLFDDRDVDQPDAVPRELGTYTIHRYLAARGLRLKGDLDDAIDLSQVAPEDVYAGGTDGYLGYLLFEAAAAYVEQGQPDQVGEVLSELNEHWKSRAAASEGRYRTDFARALAAWGTAAATDNLITAFTRVQRRPVIDDSRRDVEELSVTLARAEHLALYPGSDRDRAKAVLLALRALRLADRVQGRWRVVARSRAPLAVVFQRVYGDIALLAAGLDGQPAAELGMRVALSAKQTGFAARMRTDRGQLNADRRLLNPDVEEIIEDIMLAETVDDPASAKPYQRDDDEIDDLRFRLAEAVSPMLADTVLPVPADLGEVRRDIGDRYALDYLEVPDSLAVTRLFRCVVKPGWHIDFEAFMPSERYTGFFAAGRERGWLARGDRDLTVDDEDGVRVEFDWLRLADELLPAALVGDLAGVDPDHPIELLISAHSWLSLVPWAALELAAEGARRARLIERAVLTQTPVFTCLRRESLPPVSGDALVRLVGQSGEEARPEDGVNVEQERMAWSLGGGRAGVPLSHGVVAGQEPPQEIGGTLADALRGSKPWGFAHLAAHGGGAGLSQYLRLPGELMSFGLALTLDWPESVLMASCHVGQVVNKTDAEPLSLVMALLIGGARCVVAGISAIDDEGTGRVAERIVRQIRSTTPVPLPVALRNAQREAVDSGEPVQNWALLGAYVQ
jgi:hypothetical protein